MQSQPRLHRRHASSSSGDGSATPPAAAEQAPAAAAAPAAATIVDLEAKLALLEDIAGVQPSTALARLTMFLCSPAHHISTRLAFLDARGKLRRPPASPRLWEVICPSDAELCSLHGVEPADLAAFKRQHLASPAWADFCREYCVQQAQPEASGPAS